MSTRVANPVLVRQDETNIDDVAVATVQQEKRDSQRAATTAGKAGGDDDAVAKLANIDVGAAPVDGTAGEPDLEGGGQTQQTTTNVVEDSTTVSWWQVFFLNIVHLTGAMYLTVLSTKWISNPLTPADGRTASRQLDYWIQVTAMWTMLAFFAWTLVAPVLFKNRNFGGTCVVVGMGRPRIRQGSGDIVHDNRPLMGVCYSSNSKKQQQSWWSRCVRVLSRRSRRRARVDYVQRVRYHQYDRMAEERMVVVGKSSGRRQSVSRVKEVGAKAASSQLRESGHTKVKKPNNSAQSKRTSHRERGGGSPKASRRSHPSPARGRRGKPRRGEGTAAVAEQGAVKIPWACCCSVITGPEWCADGGDESLSTFILCTDKECQWRLVDEAGMSCQRRIAKLLLRSALPHFHQNEDQTTAATAGPSRRSRSQTDVRVLPPPRGDEPRADARRCCSLLSASPEGSGGVWETFILCDDEKCQASGECGSVQHRVARALVGSVINRQMMGREDFHAMVSTTSSPTAAAVEDRGKELARLLSVREDIEAQLVRAGKRLKVQGSGNGTDKPLG
ncbi:Serine incorporator 3, partial [Perkinsus olseni]